MKLISHYLFLIFSISVLLFFSGCTHSDNLHLDKKANKVLNEKPKKWYRGNTHTHTVLCGHADSSPKNVTAWYHDHGYNFLILSEHNKFIDPKTVEMPVNKRNDFILIPGVEITGKKYVHTTGMNVKNVVPWKYNHEKKSAIIQNHVNGAIEAGGQAILNHPNWHYSIKDNHISPVKKLHMFELFNGHPHVNNTGDHKHESTEKMWDQLLSKGMIMYGVSSDDAHHFKTIHQNKSNPGRGWVMVQSEKLNPEAITLAMLQGNFYASNGVFLKTCKRGPGMYVLEIDVNQTQKELIASPLLRGKLIDKKKEGYRIEFIGPNGVALKTVNDIVGRFKINKSIPYVRAKVIYTRTHPKLNKSEEYYAWGQPYFTDFKN